MRRLVLRVFLASIAVNAAIAIYALLSEDFGNVEGKILLTSLGVSGASVLALACGPARERRRLGPVPAAGAALSIAGFALLVAGIWNEFEIVPLWKTAGTLIAFATALAHASVLALCRLAPRYAWTFGASFVLALALAAAVSLGICGEFDDEWYWRAVGVASVLLAAFTLAVPVLHVASRREVAAATATAEGKRVRHCPICAAPVAAASGEEVVCPACRGAFRVVITG